MDYHSVHQRHHIHGIPEIELLGKLRRGEDFILVDARDAHVYDRGNIKPRDSVRIPPGEPNGEIAKLPPDKLVITA